MINLVFPITRSCCLQPLAYGQHLFYTGNRILFQEERNCKSQSFVLYILRNQCSHKFVNKFNKPNAIQEKVILKRGKFLDTTQMGLFMFIFSFELMKIFPLLETIFTHCAHMGEMKELHHHRRRETLKRLDLRLS